MSLSLAENVIVAGADNCPLCSIRQIIVHGQVVCYCTSKARNMANEEKIRESVDIKATNIVLQGLPQEIYNLVNHNEHAKQIWDRVKLLIQGSKLSLQERESKLYDDFDTFTSIRGETIHSYYMRFTQLINDMHTIGMTMKPLQVNTKFVNHLQSEWSKFVTDVKLAKDMHTTNFDHLYPDQIALVANSPSCLNLTQYYPHLLPATQQYYSPHTTQLVHQQPYQAPALQQSYQAPAIQQPSSIELDSGLVVLSFNPTDDPIANLNKLMAFVTTTFAPRFPQTNNQIRTSSNPRNQATIQDGRVTVQTVQENTATNHGVNRKGDVGQARVVKCYNYQKEGHFARQFTKPKRLKNSTWFKEKMLLTKDLESGAYLDPKELTFLADNGDTVILAQAWQESPTLAAFQTDDLDAFDSDCDDVPSADAIFMANLSSYDSYVLSECFEQPSFDNDTKFDITSDSNIISYEQYLQETENPVVQSTSSSAQQDELLMSVIEEMSSQVANCNKVQQENLIVNETLTAELKRYKEPVKLVEQR
ncbi:hypothetical protein Tco_0989544 [Tanacetum coccineum]|uniref:Integrase, catalytic region, zinc finger, CCHC-type, peptidase aspartic, catalytic n=1 Tax=Tanacetum coccineum TaxID=301880 RepID=A0ABQ5EU38_9ASTR